MCSERYHHVRKVQVKRDKRELLAQHLLGRLHFG